MKKDRNNTQLYLIDIRYNGSMNDYYLFYRDNVPYSQIEQESYIELKEMVHEMINSKIKFRKHERNGMVLTLKSEMSIEEKEKFVYLLNNDKFKFLHNYTITDFKQFNIN